ncbi:MAG: hypothetical protein GXP09_02680 [Gammaproteobacteria bacterium]|nr:hypothetical protein [Gammaproteobacteria bacterium]
MTVLIVGGGGREHALAWNTAQFERVKKGYAVPGNAGCRAGSEAGDRCHSRRAHFKPRGHPSWSRSAF